MNILYIGAINSVHDYKWVNYFSNKSDINVFFVDGSNSIITDNNFSNNKNIIVLNSISLFSIFNIFSTIKSLIKLRQYIKIYKIDIVHIMFATPYCLWAPFINCKKVLTTRGSDVLKVIPSLKKGSLKERVLFKLFKYAFSKFDIITSTSEIQKQSIISNFNLNKDIYIINTGVDIEAIENIDIKDFINPILTNKNIIFFPRYFEPIYNHELELEAIKLLDKSIFNKYFFVFIKGKKIEIDYAKKIETSIKDIEGLNYIIYDFLSQKEMFALYKQAKLTVMVPISDGTSVSAMESMASKCPLILGTVNYDESIFSDCCFKLKNNCATELADLISTALIDYPEHYIGKAYDNIKKYGNREKEMGKIFEIYKMLMKTRITN